MSFVLALNGCTLAEPEAWLFFDLTLIEEQASLSSGLVTVHVYVYEALWEVFLLH